MGRRKVKIEKISDKFADIYIREDGFAVRYDKKHNKLYSYSYSPSPAVLKNMGLSLDGFFKITLPLTEVKLRKPPSAERIKKEFRNADAKYQELYGRKK
jgi:hypothetical protein